MMVNPHFFGKSRLRPGTANPCSSPVGTLSAQRKNHELLVEVLGNRPGKVGYRNFSVIIGGEGELEKIPAICAPSCMLAGKARLPRHVRGHEAGGTIPAPA